MMKRRIFRGAAYVILTLSVPAIGWGLKEKEVISNVPVQQEQLNIQSTVVSETVSAETLFNNHINEVYKLAGLKEASLDFDVYKKAIIGYYNLKSNFKVSSDKQILSIVDFSKPSSKKRLWIVDLGSKKLLYHTLVAHGRGSGGLMATNFSNTAESHQSSLGFYVTDDTYFGKHGLSLRLNGLDKGSNTNALSRAIVVHGADYVSERFVNQNGYLGRSHGCPALPVELTSEIIKTIKGKTALFIYSAPVKSDFLNTELAINSFTSANQAMATL
jgi:hypothetical protein